MTGDMLIKIYEAKRAFSLTFSPRANACESVKQERTLRAVHTTRGEYGPLTRAVCTDPST